LREPAHGLGEWPRAMARRGRRLPDVRISGPLGFCTHIGVGPRRNRFSTIDERGQRCFREPAHGLGKCLRAMARRGRLLPDVRISAPSVVARILVWARDTTDERGRRCLREPAHGLREWPRAMARRGRLFAGR
jgi:hypothetical protein